MQRVFSKFGSSKGNALFLILIAVALFAALSYAVTQSGRGGSGAIEKEQAQLAASMIVQQASKLKYDLDRMLLLNGLTIEQIDVHLDYIIEGGDVAACVSTSCNLMSSNGGDALLTRWPLSYMYPSIPDPYSTWYAAAGGMFWFVVKYRMKNVGTDLPDMVLKLHGIKIEICDALNALAKNTLFPATSSNGWADDDSAIPMTQLTYDIPPSMMWCRNDNNIHGGSFFYFLYAR